MDKGEVGAETPRPRPSLSDGGGARRVGVMHAAQDRHQESSTGTDGLVNACGQPSFENVGRCPSRSQSFFEDHVQESGGGSCAG